jgi:S1-C subfamily serine protease
MRRFLDTRLSFCSPPGLRGRLRLRGLPRRLASVLFPLVLLLAAAPAAAESWQLFATAKTAKVFFDRESVRVEDGYVHYRVRIEYGAPRDTRDRKHRYSTSVSSQAAQCEARKVAVTSAAIFDASGTRLTESTRAPERWRQALTDVGTDGLQARLLQHACAISRGENPSPPVAKSAQVSIGAGIVVTTDGLILTNHHVAQNCTSIAVLDAERGRAKATIVGADVANDLTLLRAERAFSAVASFRRGAALQAGESVTVVGFPLASVLGFEPNVTFGYVSATGGLRGDSTRFQISAPIHKGNSGGPILDQGGQVIGIVTSKLDALAVQKRMGDLPQNISFGVKGEVAQAFLEKHSAAFRSAPGGARLENTEVAAIGREVTVLVACRRNPPAAP